MFSIKIKVRSRQISSRAVQNEWMAVRYLSGVVNMYLFFPPRTRLKGASENDQVCLAGEQTNENAAYRYVEKRKLKSLTGSSELLQMLKSRQ